MRIEKGPRYRLRATPGTPEFRREYLAAVSKAEHGIAPSEPAKGGAKVGSLEWLWGAYTASTAWTNGLKPSTRYQRERLMAHVLKKVGKVPADAITSKSIINGLEERAKTPSAAKNFLSTMRHLFAWAKKHGHVPVDPTLGVEGVARPKTNGHPVWTDEDCAKFVEKWPLGTRQHLAFAIHRYTGLRRGDAVLLGRQHFRKDGTIHIASTEKNGVELIIPIHPKLVEAIKACPPSGLRILENALGQPWGSKGGYGNKFHDWALEAGVIKPGEKKNTHGIRKAAATEAAEAGATDAQLMALFGWTDPKMARLYTKSASARKLAMDGGAKVGATGEIVDLFSTG